jgi:hypothetical protein
MNEHNKVAEKFRIQNKNVYLKIGQESMNSTPDNMWTNFLLNLWYNHKVIH